MRGKRTAARGAERPSAEITTSAECPTSDIAALFDHLNGREQDRRRRLEADRLGRFDVDGQLEFGWHLNRKVRGVCPAPGVIRTPSHGIGVQGQELCSGRRSTCDYSRGAASRYLVGSSPRLAHSTAHREIACGCPAIHQDEFHVASPNAKNIMSAGPANSRLKFEA
jgi:hypothetical protein